MACEAKDGKRQRHPVSVAARISSTADHDTPPRLCARYAMLLPNTAGPSRQGCSAARRQRFWDRRRPNLRESLAHSV